MASISTSAGRLPGPLMSSPGRISVCPLNPTSPHDRSKMHFIELGEASLLRLAAWEGAAGRARSWPAWPFSQASRRRRQFRGCGPHTGPRLWRPPNRKHGFSGSPAGPPTPRLCNPAARVSSSSGRVEPPRAGRATTRRPRSPDRRHPRRGRSKRRCRRVSPGPDAARLMGRVGSDQRPHRRDQAPALLTLERLPPHGSKAHTSTSGDTYERWPTPDRADAAESVGRRRVSGPEPAPRGPERAVQTPARVNVTCVTPLGEGVASVS
jgi:hypothetical protein